MLTESIISARDEGLGVITPTGVVLRTFVSEDCGAVGFSTGLARFASGAYLPYHLHAFSEAVTVLEGTARMFLEGRMYILRERDCIHVPAGIAHQVENAEQQRPLVVHWASASARPVRTLVNHGFPVDERGLSVPAKVDPESISRFDQCAIYELSEDAFFSDFFAKRSGAEGICGGYGRFSPGASLPCHVHDFDESITIVKGSAVCFVQGRSYELSGYDTAFIRKGTPHRFINRADSDMAMIWVYAGNEPDRILVDARFCTGQLKWRGAKHSQVHAL
ncbi:MAG TPA: cupin domain-containing protein [Terracidiphilus sp.]|nr:cupin domain-containing protein [Terracidiphilus sp.]